MAGDLRTRHCPYSGPAAHSDRVRSGGDANIRDAPGQAGKKRRAAAQETLTARLKDGEDVVGLRPATNASMPSRRFLTIPPRSLGAEPRSAELQLGARYNG